MKKFISLFFTFIFFASLSAFSKEIKIAQITDIAYSASAEDFEIEDNLLKFIQEVNSSNYDLVVFSGDMTKKSKKEDIEKFTQIAKQLKKPYYIALGENDVHKASGIKKEDYMRYANYHNKYLKTDSPNYRVNLSNKITMLVLDGASPVVKNTHGYFSEKTLLWFDKQLKKNKNKKVVIFQHFPIVPPEENYKYETNNADKYLDVIRKHNNILFIAAGHFDKENTFIDEYGVEHIATPAFKKSPYPYREIIINDKTFEITTNIKELQNE